MKTDIELQQDVVAELRWEPKVNPAHIGVEVNNGIVTLSGHVDNFSEKIAAIAAAKRVSGVGTLAVELDVIIPGSFRRSDSELAKLIKDILKWSDPKLAEHIFIQVEDGVVILSGHLEWQHQKETAEQLIHNLSGISGITNNIEIRPSLTAPLIKADIEAALQRQTHKEIEDLTVAINGDVVTIQGKVYSWRERNSILYTAWSIPGVRKVIDQFQVTY